MKIIKDARLDIPDDIGREFLTKLMGGRLIPQMEEMLEDRKKTCENALRPSAVYDTFDIDKIDRDSVYFESGHIFNGPNI